VWVHINLRRASIIDKFMIIIRSLGGWGSIVWSCLPDRGR
jgi:hypothetical protein